MSRPLVLLACLAALSPTFTAAASSIPPSLDVVDVATDSLGPRWPDRTDRQLQVVIHVADLGAAAPALDGPDTWTRHYYEVNFTHSGTNATYVVRCYIHLADLVVNNPIGAGHYGVSRGCDFLRDNNLNTLLEARMTLDLLADTVTITVNRPYWGGLSLQPGTTLRNVHVLTAGGEAATTAGSAFGQATRGPTVDVFGPLTVVL